MENIAGHPGSVPPLALYPSESIRVNIPRKEWESCLESWIQSIDCRLRLTSQQFSNFKFSHDASGSAFLVSYLQQYPLRTEQIESGSLEAKLHHRCYFLLKRLLLTTAVPYSCNAAELFILIGSGSVAFHTIPDWKSTLRITWKRNESQLKNSIEAQKHAIIDSSQSDFVASSLRQTTALIRCLPESAIVAVTGSDYLEGVMNLYAKSPPDIQDAITESTYYSLRSLMSDLQKRTSLLLDIVFEFKSGAERAQKTSPSQPTLLSSLTCTTSLLRYLMADPAISEGKRGQNLVESLTKLKIANAHLHTNNLNRKIRHTKGKGKAKEDHIDEMHVHKASQISQVHDLFPDLPHGYILKLLDHFSDDVEATIAGLLEPNSLPSYLQDSKAPYQIRTEVETGPKDLAPHATPPLLPERKNVFDDDVFDKLQISSTQIHRGRRELNDQPQSAAEKSRSKAAIMAALAAFDADDDERDDTYDVADVGGAVDNTLDSDEQRDREQGEKFEEILFRAWLENPTLFARDSKTRLSNARRQLKDDTKMGDEQIEGWSIMVSRDSKLEDRLRQKYSVNRAFHGNQSTIASTKWRANVSPSESQDEGSDSKTDGRRVGAAGIRGTRNWNAGRGRGSTSGNPNDHATQMARKRKEQGRGRGGASHRKDGRAKKLGRGMASSNS